MKKNISRIIGVIMQIVAIVFVMFSLNHPKKSFPWNNTITWLLYGVYFLDSGAAYCSKDEEVRILSFSICPLREDSSFSQRTFLLYARSYINPQLTCPQKTAIIKCSRFRKLQFLWDCPFLKQTEIQIGSRRKNNGNQKVYGKRHFCNGLYLE